MPVSLARALPASPGGRAILALSLLGAALGLWALWPVNPRIRVAEYARAELGKNDAAIYWADVLPGTPPSGYPKDWCGGFALWALHRAGLAQGFDWVIGEGFLFHLPHTQEPQIGDIAYFDTNQHHAVVVGVDRVARTVALVNGNGTGGAVSASVVPMAHVAGFYSIEPLLGAAHTGRVMTGAAALGGAVTAGAGAWALWPGDKDDSG